MLGPKPGDYVQVIDNCRPLYLAGSIVKIDKLVGGTYHGTIDKLGRNRGGRTAFREGGPVRLYLCHIDRILETA